MEKKMEHEMETGIEQETISASMCVVLCLFGRCVPSTLCSPLHPYILLITLPSMPLLGYALSLESFAKPYHRHPNSQ